MRILDTRGCALQSMSGKKLSCEKYHMEWQKTMKSNDFFVVGRVSRKSIGSACTKSIRGPSGERRTKPCADL